MTLQTACSACALMLVAVLTANTAAAQPMALCEPNSPERKGDIGCSIIDSKVLPDGLREPVFWHIDRFESPERASKAVGPASIAFDAVGTSWLMTIESQTSDHHGGQHVAQVGPLPLPKAPKLSMNVLSSAFAPGMYSTVHHHSGVEAVYMLEGEQCAETRTQGTILRKGDTLVIPTSVPMRLVVTGSTTRRQLAVIVHDAAQPPTTRMQDGTGPLLVACK